MSTINRLGIDLSGDHLDLYLAGADGHPLVAAHRLANNWPGSQAAMSGVLGACRRSRPTNW